MIRAALNRKRTVGPATAPTAARLVAPIAEVGCADDGHAMITSRHCAERARRSPSWRGAALTVPWVAAPPRALTRRFRRRSAPACRLAEAR
jgi:hypothetical protein